MQKNIYLAALIALASLTTNTLTSHPITGHPERRSPADGLVHDCSKLVRITLKYGMDFKLPPIVFASVEQVKGSLMDCSEETSIRLCAILDLFYEWKDSEIASKKSLGQLFSKIEELKSSADKSDAEKMIIKELENIHRRLNSFSSNCSIL